MRVPFSSNNLRQKIDRSFLASSSADFLKTSTAESISGDDSDKSPLRDFLSKEILIGQDIERKRIACDLHDSFGQKLNAIHLHMCALEKILEDTQRSREILIDVKSMVDESIVSLREISSNLMPSSLIVSGIKNTIIQLINQQNNINPELIEYEIDDLEFTILTQQETVFVFRIIQEFINKSIKYSQAHKIYIEKKNTPYSFPGIFKDKGI